MLGFNWIDAIIVVLLAVAVVEGVRIGFLTQVFMVAGFFVTLVVAGWLFPHLLPLHDPTLRTVVNASCVLVVASYAAVRSMDLGQGIHWSFRLGKLIPQRHLRMVETLLGSLPALAACLVVVWLLGVTIGRLPFEGFSNSVNDSRIVQQLTQALPAVPAVLAQFNRHIDPNAQPYVFVQPKPNHDFNYSPADVAAAESRATASVVRITSFGCGGVVGATGFAVGPGLVATNAHVVAGVKRPIIKYKGASYQGVPVVFDAALDLAVLRVAHLAAPPLVLAKSSIPLGTTVAVLGYPNSNYRAVPGIVRDTLAVSARTIYDQGAAGRGIYVVQAQVDYGSSGSPIVLAGGQVAGMLFSQSIDTPSDAYALTSEHLVPAVAKAQTSHLRVSTGACMVQ